MGKEQAWLTGGPVYTEWRVLVSVEYADQEARAALERAGFVWDRVQREWVVGPQTPGAIGLGDGRYGLDHATAGACAGWLERRGFALVGGDPRKLPDPALNPQKPGASMTGVTVP